MSLMHNNPHLTAQHDKAIELLTDPACPPSQKEIIKLLLEILEAQHAHDNRIARVESGFAKNDPPGHRKVHESYMEKAKLAKEDIRSMRMKWLTAIGGAGILWVIQLIGPILWNAFRAGVIQ